MSDDPLFYVTIYVSQADGGGQHEVSERVISLAYDDDEAKADKLTLSVDNFDLSNLDAPIWKSGNKLEVSWGYPGNMSPPRLMAIQSVKGSVTLTVEALDPSIFMNKVQKIRTFEKKKRSEVAAQIATEAGYGPDQQFIEDTEIVLPQVTQARMTDAQLLRDMAKREGFEFFVDFDGFHFHRRKLGQRPLRRFVYYTDLTGDIISWNIENDLYVKKAGGITQKGIDPKTKEPFSVDGDNVSTKDQTALAPLKTIITGISGRDGSVTGDFEAASGTSAVGRSQETTKEAAQRSVSGAYTKNQMNAAELTMECRGDPAMIAKTIVTVDGIGKTISGNYYVSNVQHKVGQGYVMTMKVKRDGKTAPNNAAAYANQNTTPAGKGVPAAGPTNTAEPKDAKPGDPPADLIPIAARDGSFSFSNPGRNQETPAAPVNPKDANP